MRCGTTIHAAQKLGRQWIGIDVTYLAINLIKRRLKDAFGADAQFEERGQPTDFGSAKALAELDQWQFQQWALSLIDARPRTEGDGKGADRGVDGMLYFYDYVGQPRGEGRVRGNRSRAPENPRANQRRRRPAQRCFHVARRREQSEIRRRHFNHAGKTHEADARRSGGCGPLRIQNFGTTRIIRKSRF